MIEFSGILPSFFTAGGNNENPELHKYLLSTYRGIISGGIGKCRPFGEDVFLKSTPAPGNFVFTAPHLTCKNSPQ